jgi:hypothetical protein
MSRPAEISRGRGSQLKIRRPQGRGGSIPPFGISATAVDTPRSALMVSRVRQRNRPVATNWHYGAGEGTLAAGFGTVCLSRLTRPQRVDGSPSTMSARPLGGRTSSWTYPVKADPALRVRAVLGQSPRRLGSGGGRFQRPRFRLDLHIDRTLVRVSGPPVASWKVSRCDRLLVDSGTVVGRP